MTVGILGLVLMCFGAGALSKEDRAYPYVLIVVGLLMLASSLYTAAMEEVL